MKGWRRFWADAVPDDRVSPGSLGDLLIDLPDEDNSVRYWIRYRPDLDVEQQKLMATECVRRISSLQEEGLTAKYEWDQRPDGRLQVTLTQTPELDPFLYGPEEVG